MQFIYVMKKELRDKLISRGFTLLKENEASSLWIFENHTELQFEYDEKCPHFVYSDILSF